MINKWNSVPLLALLGGLSCIGISGTSDAAALPTVPTFYNTSIQNPHYPNFWAVGASATLTSTTWWSWGKSYTDYKLSVTAPANAIFDNNSAYYKVGSPTLQITAYFDPYGNLITGYGGRSFSDTYDIYGKGTRASGTPALPASSNPTAGTPPAGSTIWSTVYSNTLNCPGSPCLLYGEKLTAVGADTTNSGSVHDEALGFTTNNFSGWANRPPSTLPESLWLFLNGSTSTYSTSEITSDTAWNNFLAEIRTHSTSTPLTSLSDFTISNQVTSISTVPLPPGAWLLGAALAGLAMLSRRRRMSPRGRRLAFAAI